LCRGTRVQAQELELRHRNVCEGTGGRVRAPLQAAEAEKLERAAAEEREKAKKKVFNVVKPVSTLDKLRNTLVTMKKVRAHA